MVLITKSAKRSKYVAINVEIVAYPRSRSLSRPVAITDMQSPNAIVKNMIESKSIPQAETDQKCFRFAFKFFFHKLRNSGFIYESPFSFRSVKLMITVPANAITNANHNIVVTP